MNELIDSLKVNIKHYEDVVSELEYEIMDLQSRVITKTSILNNALDHIESLKFLLEKEYEKVGK